MSLGLSEIRLRDPFVLPLADRETYYLFGTTDPNPWHGPATGFDCYHSRDLENWEGPHPIFRPEPAFWATTQFWAPEVHLIAGRFHLFATFKAPGKCRACQILVADRPEGPYVPWSDGPVTPRTWECLDGTLHLDARGDSWIVFCHEWLQIHDGAIYALRLTPDLREPVGPPLLLFHASQAPWVRPLPDQNGDASSPPSYVTDGPFFYRTPSGALLLLWSSFGEKGYAVGLARSVSGTLSGPWIHQPEPLWEKNGGHAMIFSTFDHHLHLALHAPNNPPNETPIFLPLVEERDTLRLA